MPGWGPCTSIARRHVPLWARRRCHPRPAHLLVGAAAGSLRPGCSVGGGVFVLSLPLSVLHRYSLICGGHSGGFVPRGNSSTPGVLVPCGNSTPPSTPWRYPNGFSATPEASRPPSSPPTLEDSFIYALSFGPSSRAVPTPLLRCCLSGHGGTVSRSPGPSSPLSPPFLSYSSSLTIPRSSPLLRRSHPAVSRAPATACPGPRTSSPVLGL